MAPTYLFMMAAMPGVCTSADKPAECALVLDQAFAAQGKLDRCLFEAGGHLAKTNRSLADKYETFVMTCSVERSKCVSGWMRFRRSSTNALQFSETVKAWQTGMGNAAHHCDERFKIIGPRTIGADGDRAFE